MGFLGEAQLECCPIHVLINVVSSLKLVEYHSVVTVVTAFYHFSVNILVCSTMGRHPRSSQTCVYAVISSLCSNAYRLLHRSLQQSLQIFRKFHQVCHKWFHSVNWRFLALVAYVVLLEYEKGWVRNHYT